MATNSTKGTSTQSTNFVPTQAQLQTIGTLAYNGANKLVGVNNGIVKMQVWYYNTKTNQNIVTGTNSNGKVSAYGVLHVTLYLTNNSYSVQWQYVASAYQTLPTWLVSALQGYKQVSANAQTLATLQQQIANLQAKAAKLAK